MFSRQQPFSLVQLPPHIQHAIQGRTLKIDSRHIQAGDVFVACQGEYTDGRQYIPEAIERGASFIFWDDDGTFAWQDAWHIDNYGISQLHSRSGLLASTCYQNIAEQLWIWGVTGTNGKTSISQWLGQAADLLGEKCAIMGTVGNGFWPHLQTSTHTTLDAVSIQTWLRSFVKEQAQVVAMEVSSHGLDQNRVVGVPFTTAVFTNLTRDHLDYHGSMEKYGACKEKLFHWNSLQHAVINIDDDFGRHLAQKLRGNADDVKVYTYGFSRDADVRIQYNHASPQGMYVHIDTPWGSGEIHTRLLGRFNAQNLAACVGVLGANKFDFTQILQVLAQIKPATGRMDCLMEPSCPLVVVDYAHTPDALEKALTTLQEIKPKHARLWCVFGCGGNRDRGKRPLMGAVAASGADCVVVTSDNPRMEEPDSIIQDILPAVPRPQLVETDRKRAICYAVSHAAEHDIILIAGKGHETYQDIHGEKHHFSDHEVARWVLRQRHGVK